MEPLLELARAHGDRDPRGRLPGPRGASPWTPGGHARRRARHRRALLLPDEEPGRARRRRGRARERSRPRDAAAPAQERRADEPLPARELRRQQPPGRAAGRHPARRAQAPRRPGPSAAARWPPSTCESSPTPVSACRASSPTRGPSTTSSSCATPGATPSPKRSPSSGVGTLVHYPVPLHLQPAFADPAGPPRLPVAERACAEILSLPLYPELSDEQALPRRRGRARGGRPRPVLGSGLV